MVGSIFDANQQNKTRLVNMFYYRDVITIAKLKTWAPCVYNEEFTNKNRRCKPFKGQHMSCYCIADCVIVESGEITREQVVQEPPSLAHSSEQWKIV